MDNMIYTPLVDVARWEGLIPRQIDPILRHQGAEVPSQYGIEGLTHKAVEIH